MNPRSEHPRIPCIACHKAPDAEVPVLTFRSYGRDNHAPVGSTEADVYLEINLCGTCLTRCTVNGLVELGRDGSEVRIGSTPASWEL